jgi:hypothetical protein
MGGHTPAGTVPQPLDADKDLQAVSDTIKGDFKSSLQRFGTHISHVLQQLGGDVHLVVPNIVIDDPAAAGEDYEIVEQLEVRGCSTSFYHLLRPPFPHHHHHPLAPGGMTRCTRLQGMWGASTAFWRCALHVVVDAWAGVETGPLGGVERVCG